jgi:hypothetical protein
LKEAEECFRLPTIDPADARRPAACRSLCFWSGSGPVLSAHFR